MNIATSIPNCWLEVPGSKFIVSAAKLIVMRSKNETIWEAMGPHLRQITHPDWDTNNFCPINAHVAGRFRFTQSRQLTRPAVQPENTPRVGSWYYHRLRVSD